MQARITKSLLWTATRTLVYRDKIFVTLGEGVPLELGRQIGVPSLKRRYFAAVGSYSVKTVADRYRTSTGDRFLDLATSITLNDLEPHKKVFLVNFFRSFLLQRTFQQ